MLDHFLVKMMSPSHGGLVILVEVTLLISGLILYGHYDVDFVLIFCLVDFVYGYIVAQIWIKFVHGADI